MGKVIEMKRATLSMQQANLLFNRECMAMGGKDCISIRCAIGVLNSESVQYALKGEPGKMWNMYSVFGGVKYLTYAGYISAVGYYNAMQESYYNEVLENDSSTGQSNE